MALYIPLFIQVVSLEAYLLMMPSGENAFKTPHYLTSVKVFNRCPYFSQLQISLAGGEQCIPRQLAVDLLSYRLL
jgi:hypothetical protein